MLTADVIKQLAAFPSKRAQSEDVHEAARSEVLTKLPPLQVLNLFYSRKLSQQRPAVVAGIRSRFKTRKELLTWIYRDERVFQDVNYVHLPSLEKRVLVSRLVGYARKRYAWITPRLLHAFAFRPEFFREKARSNPQHQWTALYRRVSIPKGKSGHRDLWIPSPPLRRVQRCLLELSLNHALSELPPCVNGCRPRLPGDPRFGIFRNAAAHLGQQYVASFDLADFFPSVKVEAIIPTLLAIKTPMVIKSPDADAPDAVPFAWTHDAAVFVARLVTHRGQLPQGAPTSPAIANLVFQAYDDRILERLGPDFVYTRYVDDIAISVSASAAHRLGIGSSAAMRGRVQSVLDEVLAKSGFRLNPRKTKVSDLNSGHHVTGLRVSKDEVSLPRDAKRRIRSLLYRVRTHGFVKTACELIGGEVHAQTVYRNELGRHSRWGHARSGLRNDHCRDGRRLSTERLAILMLKQLHPDIRIEVPDEVRYIEGERIKRPHVLHEGKDAWRDVERFLSALWENFLYVDEDEAHTVVKRTDGTVLCRMRSEKALAFFHLPKREAISTVELWHHLRGLSAGLLVKDGDRCFEPIRKLQKEIAEQLDSVRIDMPTIRRPESVAPTSEVPNVSLTPFDEVAEKASQVYELAKECHSLICQKEPATDWIKWSVVFRKPVDSTKSLKGWIDAADKMFNGTFSRLPTLGGDSKALASSIFQLLRILADRFEGRRLPVYELEKRYLGTARIQKPQIDQLDNDNALPMQRQILSSLAEVMNESVKHRKQMMHPDEWTKSLAANRFGIPLDEQLVAETNRFIELRDRAVWPDDGNRVFSDDVNSQVADHAGELAKSIANGQWTTVWKRLFEFGHMIISVTTDSGASQSGSDFLERFNAVLAKDQSDFAVVLHLRHRKAHGVSYTGLKDDSKKKIHGEWLTTQSWAKRYLGRRWSWNEKTGPRTVFFDDERDMRLTPLEGTEVKLALLVAVNRCLEKFRKAE